MSQKIIGLVYFSISIVYILFSDHLFQKGSVEQNQIIALFTLFFCGALYLACHYRIKGIFKIFFIATSISAIAFLASIFISYLYVQILFDDKTWKLWEDPDKFIANLILFLSMILTEFTLFKIYLWKSKTSGSVSIFILFFLASCKIISKQETHDLTKNTSAQQLATSDAVFTGTKGLFKDERDGKTYKWVLVGDQIWMAQNLAFKADSGCSPFRWKKRNAEKEGYLYDWETAQKVPPKGWHLPSIDEYLKLITTIGGTTVRNTFQKIVEDDYYGLNFKPNGAYWSNYKSNGKGCYNGGRFHPVKTTQLWTSSSWPSANNSQQFYGLFGIRYWGKISWITQTGSKLNRYPIRCIKDSD